MGQGGRSDLGPTQDPAEAQRKKELGFVVSGTGKETTPEEGQTRSSVPAALPLQRTLVENLRTVSGLQETEMV